MNQNTAKNLIKKTKDDYNKIADHFTSTRKKVVWPDIFESLDYMNLEKDKRVLDLGAGNGRLYPVLTEFGLNYTGVDISEELVKNAKKEFPNGKFLVGNATSLPFADNSFDYVVSVAVLFHIPSKELRRKAFAEIYRVTKPDGKVYVSVWYFWNKRLERKRIISEAFKIFIGKSDLEYGDFFRPWKSPSGKILAQRYCHAFTLSELKQYLKKTGFKDSVVVKGYNEKTRNLNIICSK